MPHSLPPEIRYEIAVFVDGSCKGNGTPDSSMAYGYRFTDIATGVTGDGSGHLGPGTNNLAEVLAFKKALEGIAEFCKSKNYPIRHTRIVIHSDSQFAINTINGSYKIRHHSVDILATRNMMKQWGKIEIKKVNGHSGHLGNQAADKLAAEAHPKKRSFSSQRLVQAKSSDVFDMILDFAEDAPNWPEADKAFALKKGKKYQIRISVREV